jgi:hypothetical protein
MPTTAAPLTRSARRARGVRFPYLYLALVFVSAMDLGLTYIVLLLGGIEVNPIANAVLQSPTDFHGLIVYKFALVAGVILICEFIGRHAPTTSRRLVIAAVAISSFPVVWSTLLLSQHL